MKLSVDIIKRVEEWVGENGLIDTGGAKLKDFCAYFKITKPTYYRWLKNITFVTVLTRAREKFREGVENRAARSLMKQVEGYRYTTTKTKSVYAEDGRGQPMIIKQETIKYEIEVQPDTQATIFLLTKINPNKWGKSEMTETPKFVIEVEDKETENIIKELMSGDGDDERDD